MSLTAIIILNIGVAAILAAILAAVMLSPTRLRRHFADGHTDRQKAALRQQQQAEAAQGRQRQRQHEGREPAWRPIQDV